MARTGRRGTFESHDRQRLLSLLDDSRALVCKCMSAAPFDSELMTLCHGANQAIMKLAVELSGDDNRYK